MKEIKLTKGYVALVDDEDFEWLSQWKWCACENKNTVYALHSFKNYKTGKQEMIGMHRFIMGISETYRIDHVDRNGLHNWRENLRRCSDADNQHNKNLYKNNTSGYKGVSYCPYLNKNKPFSAHIGFHNKLINLGYFDSADEAAKAYDEKAKELYGDFANLNFT